MKTEWRLTVTEVLKRPLFQHAEAIAGKRGLGRPIRWVHVLETAENGRFLNGGELILSTGLGFGEDAVKRLAYLTELIQRRAAGLCVELGPYIPRIPADMCELADHHDFPLIIFHQPVRFVDITLDLHEIIVNRQMDALRKLEAYARDLQQLSLHTQGTTRLQQHFQAHVQLQTFYLPCDGQAAPVYMPAMPQSVQAEMTALLKEHLLAGASPVETSGRLPMTEKKTVCYQPITAMGHVLAYLGVVLYEREPEEVLLLELDYTAAAMAQILMRTMFAAERALASESRLMEEMIAGSQHQEEQLRSLLGIRSNASSAYYAVVMQLRAGRLQENPENQTLHERFSVYRSILSRYGFRSLLTARGNRLYLMAMEANHQTEMRSRLKKALAELAKVSKQAVGTDGAIAFGVSRLSERLAEADRHFQEAEQALLFDGEQEATFFDELGIYRLLYHVPQERVLRSFIADYLEPLLRYDEENGSQYVHTLRVYLEQNLSKQETADRLYIHRQTLYHRLEKIGELLGSDFEMPHRRLCLEVALRAYDWLS
ncbi:PucR family transcriptional regulator [Brevibacillus sp. SYP-B805]|uniref:PucR family transcriptional regulator ligand-binding domain-containing protein n=1 Tax=Brevibacillus sp. SYP-B805 TaxID=1578199 RepID=UPI0013EE05DF|nr:PucR family transcriptional regulator [Brevibacillus sp. SYP-B805]